MMMTRVTAASAIVLTGTLVVLGWGDDERYGSEARASAENWTSAQTAASQPTTVAPTLKEAPPGLEVHRLKIEPMTAEAFRPFGEVWEAKERPPDRRVFFPFDYQIGQHEPGETVVRVIWQPYEGFFFTQLERHFNVTQSFIPLDGSLSVVAVAPPTDPNDPEDVPRPDQVRAFLIDGTVGFGYKVGTWHSLNRYILSPPGASFLMLNVSPNPSEVVDYDKKFGVVFEVVL